MEFQAWPKTTRLFRDIVVTEKIDGTNACIIFEECNSPCFGDKTHVESDKFYNYTVGAQSRNRLIYPGKDTDNYGFAGWVNDNAQELFNLLGPGRHYGEWWGRSIARNYGMDRRIFSLFNTSKWGDAPAEAVGDAYITAVPVLYEGVFSQRAIQEALYDLETLGSQAAPGFKNAEGVCIYHTQSKVVQKVTLDNNDKGKWEVE